MLKTIKLEDFGILETVQNMVQNMVQNKRKTKGKQNGNV